jgi:hypothetical protein
MKKLQLIHGEGEIKRLDKQIKEAFKLLDGVQLSGVYIDKHLVKKIKDLGFDYIHSSGATFIGKRQVIKVGYITRFPPPPKYRVPTLIYHYYNLSRKDYYDTHILMIQPKVDTNVKSDEDYIEMAKIEKRLSGWDYRDDNFGIYKKEVKLIDW